MITDEIKEKKEDEEFESESKDDETIDIPREIDEFLN